MIERSDFDEMLARREKEQVERLATRQQAVYARQMQVEEQHLTNDPKWDKFLTHLRPLLDDATKVMEEHKQTLLNPKTSSEGIMYLRMMGSYAQGRADVLKEVMALPKLLAAEAQGEQADALASNNGHL